MDCRPEEISLRRRYPISSICACGKICKVCCTRAWVCNERRCTHE
jgi:hypothetical protein